MDRCLQNNSDTKFKFPREKILLNGKNIKNVLCVLMVCNIHIDSTKCKNKKTHANVLSVINIQNILRDFINFSKN